MDMIYTDGSGVELGYLTGYGLDLDIGDTNDFEITLKTDRAVLDHDYRVYANGTEYGGIIREIKVDTAAKKIAYCGQTWRGILSNYIIPPPTGEDYLTIGNCTASDIIMVLLGLCGLENVYTIENSTTVIESYQFDRYCTLLDGITKMLKSINYRLNIACTNGIVTLAPVEVHDYSDELEYSQDCNLDFKITDSRNGINHLVCLGSGELKARQVINLYLQADGTIGKTQYYTGIDERAEVYDYSSVESLAELEKGGRERFSELLDRQELEMSIDEINVELGDIVGGRERITGIYMAQPITQKIVKVTDGKLKISYKVG